MSDRCSPPVVAYVLKAYPRASEPFILSEIHRLERLGLPLRLFATKPAEPDDRTPRHPVVDRIAANPEFLTPTQSVSQVALTDWLRAHGPRFAPALGRVAGRHPLGLLRASATLARELRRSRESPARRMKRTLVREFLHGVEVADRLASTPSVRHLHAHFAHGATTIAWFASHITGLPFSFTGHAKDLYSQASNTTETLRRKVDAARFVVTCTDANRRMLEALGSSTPVHCLYHGINDDFSRLLAQPPAPRTPDGMLRVLGVGRLVRKKGFDVLLDAMAAVRRQGVPVSGVIIGSDGDHAAEIRQRLAVERLGDVIELRGPQDQRTLFGEYQRADIFCLPCRVLEDGDRDGIPNVLMEAMACGTPVISTNVSGIPELLQDRVNGFIVPADDARSVAKALVEAHRDRALMARLSSAARATIAARFDGDRLARDLAALFEEAVA